MISYDIIEHGKPLQRAVRETPKPKGTEVLVRVTRCGVCHSDLHIWDGYFDLGGGKRFYVKERGCVPPFTLGHEPFGVVEALGPRAKGVKVGQKRIVYPWIGCGSCPACRAGEENICAAPRHLGITVDGGFASHVLVPHPRYLLDYAPLDAGFAGALMCSGLTAFAAIKRLGERAGDPRWYQLTRKVEEVVTAQRKIFANVDLYSSSVYRAMGIPMDLYTTTFAVSRIAGWTAHVLEQYSDNRLIRPLSEYVCAMDRTYVPLSERG